MTPIEYLRQLTIMREEPQTKKGVLVVLNRRIDQVLADILSDGA